MQQLCYFLFKNSIDRSFQNAFIFMHHPLPLESKLFLVHFADRMYESDWLLELSDIYVYISQFYIILTIVCICAHGLRLASHSLNEEDVRIFSIHTNGHLNDLMSFARGRHTTLCKSIHCTRAETSLASLIMQILNFN